MTITVSFAPVCTAVASSWQVIRKEPSPAQAITGVPGCSRDAAIPAGTSYPIDPETGPRAVPGWRNR